MPSIAPSYILAFFALIAVSSILISSFSIYMSALRAVPEVEQLENILNHIASRGYELITLTTATNSTSEAVLQLPSAIGNRLYWIRLCSEPSMAWVEGALGAIHENNVANRVYLPKAISVLGNHSSINGPAILECYLSNSTIYLHLTSWRESI